MKKIIAVFVLLLFPAVSPALTTAEAIKILDSASSQAALTRQDHVLVVESINLLRKTLTAKKAKEKDIETNPVGTLNE